MLVIMYIIIYDEVSSMSACNVFIHVILPTSLVTIHNTVGVLQNAIMVSYPNNGIPVGYLHFPASNVNFHSN